MLRRLFCKFLLAAVVIFSLFALSGAVLAQGRSDEAFEHVKAIQERYTKGLMAKPGVVGTAVGLNDKGRHDVIVLLVNDSVPGIPQELENVPVRRIVSGKIYAYIDPTDRQPRPVPIGVSTGHPAITAGTIGCRVYDDKNGDGVRDLDEPVFALSNNHVYAHENLAERGDPVIQPGTFDGGLSPADDIGTLAVFKEIKFDGTPNIIDAAIASTTTALVDNKTPSDGYGTPKSTTVTPGILQSVQKYGRTTGLTSGMVFATNSAVNVEYSSGDVAYYENQIMIMSLSGDFSAGGDSGSLVLTDPGREPVGLLFAGGGSYTFANPIGQVLSWFNVKIDSSEGPINSPPVANFSGSPTSGGVPLAVDFTDLSTGNPTSWSWDFGDGRTSTAQNPSHTYNTTGTYSVTLTVTNEYGTDIETKAGYINVNVPLVADFEGSPRSGDAPLTVHFTDLSTGDPYDWGWDFGDGSPWMIFLEPTNPYHIYDTPGTYTVFLGISDGIYTDWMEKVDYITVTGETVNTPPTADFTYTATGLSVDFTDQSTDSEGSVVAWSWNFGDDATSTAQNPSHTYAASGIYMVTLIVTDDDGAMNTTSKTVTVSAPLPTPTLSVSVFTEYPTYRIGDRVYITVEVSDDFAEVPVGGATVNLLITTANKQYVNYGTTNAAGEVTFGFKIKKPDGTGSYVIKADASLSGYDSGSEVIYVTVN